jgi:hypothetical protein
MSASGDPSERRPTGALGGYWRVLTIMGLEAATLLLRAGHNGHPASAFASGVTLAYLAIGPGLAITGLLRLDDVILDLSLALALSLVLETLLATGMILIGHWKPTQELAVVEVLTVLGAIVQVNQVVKANRRNHHQHTSA